MKYLLFALAVAGALFAAACGSTSSTAPHLGKVVDGFLVNVDAGGVILQGYDPVSFRRGGALPGDPAITTKYHGAIYRFASAANKAAFEASPQAFEPAFGGYCAYGLSVGHLAPIELWTFDTTFRNYNLYQHNQKAINGWKKDIPGNYERAVSEWTEFQKTFIKS